MSDELQPGRSLLDRFVLQRGLRATAGSHLWLARDERLETTVLLQIYPGIDQADDAVRVAIARSVRAHRRVRHRHLAAVGDLHDAGDLLIVSLDAGAGRLLADDAMPRPHRDLIQRCRPLVDALADLHDGGDEHGRIDLAHLLERDDDGSWVLLPGDGTQPPRPDLPRLGDLMASLLTGGRPPAGSVNDAPELLHGGRTVPALLDQLVRELRASDPATRPAGMRDVVTRLDQIEAFSHAPAAAAPPPSPASTARPAVTPRPRPARPARPPRRNRLRWLLVPAGIVAAGLLVLSAERAWRANRRAEPPAPVAATPADETSTPIAHDPEPPAVDPARRAAARAEAESTLNGMLAARRAVDELGAAEWGVAAYDVAAAASVAADQAFLEQRFEDAARDYDAARAGFERVLEAKDETLARLLREGADALQTPDAARAEVAFRRALLIEPGREAARIGRERAGTLEELHRRLASARTHESEGRLDFAYADYAAAAELDPRSEEAVAGHRRLRGTLAEQQFQTMMARGLEAYHRGAYDDARQHLAEAQRFRPGAVEVTQALAMVEEAQLRADMDRLRDDAIAHEHAERWQDAWNVYRQVLAMDPAIEFAQEGKDRCESMIRLEKLTNYYLANPELLTGRGTRADAKQLAEQLGVTEGLGPRLHAAAARLREQVRLANTPLQVTLVSDEQTEVAVYRVAQLGVFDAFAIELLPGVYTVVGHRNGYRDVRLELRLAPGQTGVTLTVVCTERI